MDYQFIIAEKTPDCVSNPHAVDFLSDKERTIIARHTPKLRMNTRSDTMDKQEAPASFVHGNVDAPDRRQPLLEILDVRKHYPLHRGVFRSSKEMVKAVDGVTLTVHAHETLGLVGESGCGKTTLGYLILQLTRLTSGRILFEGKDVTHLSVKDETALRKDMQIIFQDPFSSLNPRLTIGSVLREVLSVHRIVPYAQLEEEVNRLLMLVGLDPSHRMRYPHEFSGGQRQRIVIARALALRPKFIVCDEAVSSLDISIQAQILNLLRDLQDQFGLTYLFISHNLNVVRHMADRVAVMYVGKIVELCDYKSLYGNPKHPYTKALLASNPVPDPTHIVQRSILNGDVPSAAHLPTGCSFHPRCPEVFDDCAQISPELASLDDGRLVRCLLFTSCYPHATNS